MTHYVQYSLHSDCQSTQSGDPSLCNTCKRDVLNERKHIEIGQTKKLKDKEQNHQNILGI